MCQLNVCWTAHWCTQLLVKFLANYLHTAFPRKCCTSPYCTILTCHSVTTTCVLLAKTVAERIAYKNGAIWTHTALTGKHRMRIVG